MGSERSGRAQPIHEVIVPSFEIMKTEVTVEMYRKCVESDYCTEPNLKGDNEDCNWDYTEREDHPVDCINWFQAMEFAAWVGARLPTEAEWEYVARGEGGDVIYPWGNEDASCSLAVYNRTNCNLSGTLSVCSKPAGNTQQGICDMAGNVSEWLQDEAHYSYERAPSNGRGWCSEECPLNASDANYVTMLEQYSIKRMVRGGSWYHSDYWLETYTRWDRMSHTTENYSIGVRLAQSL